MKRKYLVAALAVLIVLLLMASIPRLSEIKSVNASEISDYPVLQRAYTDLCEEYSLYEIATEDTIHIITIKNLWGTWRRYVLPCYSSYLPTVPTAGSTDGHIGLHVLAPWSHENLFTNLFRLKVRDFSVYMEPGENLFVYEKAEVTHASMYPGRIAVYSKLINFDDAVICDRQPTVFVDYILATSDSARERNETAKTKFTLEYSLRFMGRQIWTGSYILEKDHIVNA